MPLYNPTPPTPHPSLIVPRSEAKAKIEEQLQKGPEIRNLELHSEEDLNLAIGQESKWRNVNITLLQSIFSNSYYADEYAQSTRRASISRVFEEEVKLFRKRIGRNITGLERILESLQYISELVPPVTSQSQSEDKLRISNKVFIVHGHDEGKRDAVASLLRQLNLSPVILAEQASQGQTIIEKFEQASSDVGYAVVLLTPDDIGTSKNRPDELKPRARQNVIFELGYFAAKLGRKNVCALYKGGIEIPSDYHGVVYVSMDSDDWKWRLALEIKQVMPVDLNLMS